MGAMHSGVVSFSSFVPISPSPGMRRTVYRVLLLLILSFFFNFFLTMLHSYHSRYNDGNWTSILAYFCPRRVGRTCGNRYILVFEQPIRARVSGYILDIQITH